MKAAVYYGRHNLKVTEVDIPAVGDNQVRVKVKYCGVCGTDIHIYNGDGGAAEVVPPAIIGHEFSGVVEQVGANVKSVKPGDRVAIDPNDMCGECYFAETVRLTSVPIQSGMGPLLPVALQKYVVAKEKQVYKSQTTCLFRQRLLLKRYPAAFMESILCDIKAGQTVLIIGCGPIGLLMLQLAKLAGAGKIIASEIVPEKRELALKFGADIVVDPINEDLDHILNTNTENVDCVIECAGTIRTIEQAIHYAGKGATVMMFGLTAPDAVATIKPYEIFQKELKVTSSFINPYTFSRAIQVLSTGKVVTDDIITDVIPLDEINKVFEDDSFRSRGKILIKIN